MTKQVSTSCSMQRFFRLLSLCICVRPVQSQEGFFATLFELLGRPCNTNSDAERCNGSGYIMKIGSDGTVDCAESCATIPLFKSASGYACGSCAPIPSKAPSSTSAPALAPSSASAPALAPSNATAPALAPLTATAPVLTPNGVPPESTFDITIDLVGQTSSLSIFDRLLFGNAARRFESIITTGLSDVPKTELTVEPEFDGCAYPTVIDDVYICVRVAAGDGVGRVLGYASPSYLRPSDGLTVAGYINLDVADIENLINLGGFEDVLTHEIGHILGIGTNFVKKGIAGTDSQNCPYYGTKANAEFAKISRCDVIPMEQDGGSGTRCSHWDDTCLKNELMTGYVDSSGGNILSRISIGALEDLGYPNVDYSKAQFYSALDLGTCSCRRRSLATSRGPLLREGRRRKLSEETIKYAYDIGLEILRQQPTPVAAVVGGLIDSTTDNKALYVGNRMVSVLVQENPDGDIIGVHVNNPDYIPQ